MTVQEEKQIEELAYMYARSLVLYGVDIQGKYESATSVSMALERSYIKGRSDERNSLKDAIKELYTYRALGTVEELQEAREKQVAKKVIGIKAKLITRHCPSCQEWAVFELKRGMKFCPSCGQKLDWSEEDD